MKKHEWRKSEKQFYLPKSKPEVIDIPGFNFISISGQGNPNGQEFKESILALYSVAYAIKMNLKKLPDPPPNYTDYAVYPLEGIWDVNVIAKAQADYQFNKDDLVYNIMIRQPEFVSQGIYEEMLELTKKKKPHPYLEHIKFESIQDGKCVQMLHIGSYDDEPATFANMEDFCKENDLVRSSKKHREIYLSDFRKVAEDKLKTVLRFQLK